MKKAQMSLEMIIGLLILLVVAYVVIKMFMSKINIDKIPKPEDTTKYLDFKAKCEGLCSDFINYGTKASLSNYCSEKLKGIDDLNNDGLIESFEATSLSLKICEDAVYCFQIIPCKTSTGIVSWSQCRQAMCNAKYEVYKNWTKADEKVKELVPGPGTCRLPEDENWWNMYFSATPCTNPGKPPSEQDAEGQQFSIALGACTIESNNNWTFNCEITSTSGLCESGVVAISDQASRFASAAFGNANPDKYGTVNFGQRLNGNLDLKNGGKDPALDFSNNPPQNPCVFAILCDINKDGKIEEGVDVQVASSSCQIV